MTHLRTRCVSIEDRDCLPPLRHAAFWTPPSAGPVFKKFPISTVGMTIGDQGERDFGFAIEMLCKP